MTLLDYLSHIGKHDKTGTQLLYAALLFMLFNSIMFAALVWPFILNQQTLNASLEKAKTQYLYDKALLKQGAMLSSRYQEIMAAREQGASCEWLPGKEVDNIDLPFAEARGCLASWVEHNNKTITELTFYKKGKVRSLEVMHD